ncbi:MAG: acyltransferase family protein [Actinomycetota bacterium]|nr:acyltransferase family protein [Actinomycetota bacterium]
MAAPTVTVAEPLSHPALRHQISRVPYLPGLDGLRALAVTAVLVYHANHDWLSGGFIGVEVFFVISGYLITLLLLAEHERNGRVRLGAFWMRRARRLLPALFVMMGALAVYMSLFNTRPMGQTRGDLLAGTFYVSNWFQIWVGQGYTSDEAFAPLRHLWSLAVEEQFYLVWPIVMLVLLRTRGNRLPRVALWLFGISVFIALVTAAMYIGGTIFVGADPVTGAPSCGPGESHGYLSVFGRCINVNESLYLGSFSRAGGLMIGSAFALVWRPVAIMRGPLRTRGRRVDVLALFGLAGLAWMMFALELQSSESLVYDPWLFRGGLFLTGLCTVAVIAAATHRRSWIGRLLGIRPLHWVGTRSYGLYLYHWPIYQIIRTPGEQLTLVQFLTALCIAIPFTELSYRLVELPVRQGRLGEWLRGERPARTKAVVQRRRRTVALCSVFAVLTGFATVSVATADILCEGTTACASEEGLVAIEGGAVTTVPVTAPPTTERVVPVDPGATVPPITEPAPTTTLGPVDLLPPYAIGESVMLGAAPQLTAGGVQVNAAVSRQGANTAEVVALLRAGGKLGRVVVIQTGTNGSVSDATLDSIMSHLPPEATPLVVFLTVRAPRGWIADNNTRIRQLPDRYPNVQVLDWEVESEVVAGELARDGYHLGNNHARQFYANLIFAAIGRPELMK